MLREQPFRTSCSGTFSECRDMDDIMNGPIRKQFLDRPMRLMEEEDCSECKYMCPLSRWMSSARVTRRRAICFTKEPNCESFKTLFRLTRKAAIEIDRLESVSSVGTAAALPRLAPSQRLDMPLDTFSVLISPTFRCNADCGSCFEKQDLGRDGTERFRADTSGNSPRHFLRT